MKRSPAVLQLRRAELERRIEELIALLDLLDGDENLEPYLTDTDPRHEDRESDDDFEPPMSREESEGLRVHIRSERKQLQAMGYDCGLWRAS
ncbi:MULTISPECIES: hypothetical protein [Rhizobium/Agrobacterium group]|uniref:hypothetical protein n=1 Tax=Rhizobium/Agrobacterium group TaxID=227290 RepID=UPI000D1B1844|nr:MULTISPECIES: hypothetical protein [Rhizobium/Agrobacterium group]QSZ56979.1 hypothetical protein BTN45_07555 [Rhizobium sp. ZX09]